MNARRITGHLGRTSRPTGAVPYPRDHICNCMGTTAKKTCCLCVDVRVCMCKPLVYKCLTRQKTQSTASPHHDCGPSPKTRTRSQDRDDVGRTTPRSRHTHPQTTNDAAEAPWNVERQTAGSLSREHSHEVAACDPPFSLPVRDAPGEVIGLLSGVRRTLHLRF